MRYTEARIFSSLIHRRPHIATALIKTFRGGYSAKDFRADVLSGIVVGLVAIPLGMALAIAVGVPPQQGLYTVVIGGLLTAALGGSRFNVTGPTAAFVVILLPIVAKFGITGLLTAGLLAGLFLVLMGLLGIGRAIRMIPHPVTTGFTAGIAVVIALIQVKDFFGLTVEGSQEHIWDRLHGLFLALPTISWSETAVALTTLGTLILWPKVTKRIPAPLVALSFTTVLVLLAQRLFPTLNIATIGSRFTTLVNGETVHGIPSTLPGFSAPWNFVFGTQPPFELNYAAIQALVPSAAAIALLGAIESLLCAVVADGMTQSKHDPDAELIGLGIANIVCPFFGGIAATGAIARTATNIRFGARSPISAIVHALFALAAILLFAPYVSYLPMAALAALLILVAYNMSEIRNFIHIIAMAPRSDVAVLVTCFSLTVAFDMVVGVTVGVFLAVFLFMNRMTKVSYGRICKEGEFHPASKKLPHSVVLYEIVGPLFFGAAEKATNGLEAIADDVKVVVFDLEDVPVMDVTGLVAFETAVERLTQHNRSVIIAGTVHQPREVLMRSESLKSKRVTFVETVEDGLQNALALAGANP